MKILFLSNYMNHHQIGLSDELYNLCGEGNYWFIQEEKLTSERISLGYENDFDNRKYVIDLNNKNMNRIINLIESSDIIINCYSQGLNLLDNAIRKKKIIIWYQERLFKDYNFVMTLAKYFRARKYINYRKNPNQYHLFASYYGYRDTSKIFKQSRNKSFLFGYFPITNSTKIISKTINRGRELRLLYIGRLIEWKHPEFVFKIADLLDDKKINYVINVFGTGNMIKKMRNIANSKYSNKVIIHGSIPFNKIPEEYEKNDIFLFSSDRREGWGATLSEAMSYGLIVFANEEAGSSKVLIENTVNGFLYNKKNYLSVFENMLNIIKTSGSSISCNASRTIVENWNYKIAAERLYRVCNSIIKNESTDLFDNGIMKKLKFGDYYGKSDID